MTTGDSMENTKRAALRVLAVAAAAVGGMALASAPAQAEPGFCDLTTYGDWASSYCHTGTGGHRVVALCSSVFVGPYVKFGAWAPPGGFSSATCDSGTYLVDADIQLRD